MRYVDGFVLVVKKSKLKAYLALARKCGKIWREHGALQYAECIGEDLKSFCGMPFPKLTELGRGEVVVFSFIVYRSKAQRTKVNAKVMQDPRMAALCSAESMPFDLKRLSHAGFEMAVDLDPKRGGAAV